MQVVLTRPFMATSCVESSHAAVQIHMQAICMLHHTDAISSRLPE